MKRMLYILSVGLWAILALASCIDDDLVKTNDVVEGKPVTVTLKLSGTPAADVSVTTKASGNDLSTLSNLTIFVYDSQGSYQQEVTFSKNDLTPVVDSNTGNVTYTVKFTTTSGVKKLLAVGNRGGGLWKTGSFNPSGMDFDALKTYLLELVYTENNGLMSNIIAITADDQMLISGWNEDIVFGTNNQVTDSSGNPVVIAVQMKRAMAHITFNIAGNTGFTPTSYQIYNIPLNSYLANMEGVITPVTGESIVSFKNSATFPTGGLQGEAGKEYYSFNFYMPENVYQLVTGVNDYVDRDKWKREGTSGGVAPDDKQWTNAPMTSTFVVISGTYTGAADIVGEDGNITSTEAPVTGNVEYTIHLGDFSTTGSFGNFSVERNVSYTYNVTVNGVDKIIVEAVTDREEQSGAEGEIYDAASTQYKYNLDAHYEQVFLEYNLSAMAKAVQNAIGNYKEGMDEVIINKTIADQLILVIQSEAMDHTAGGVTNKRGSLKPYQIYSEAASGGALTAKKNALDGDMNGATAPTKGFDYKWIEFWPQSGTEFASYPGVSEWAKDSLNAIGKFGETVAMANQDYYGGKAKGNAEYLMDVYDVIVAMGNVVKKIYKGGTPLPGEHAEGGVSGTDFFTGKGITVSQSGDNYVARFTAFVNEYYYLRHPLTGARATMWSVFVNKIPREMIIAMSTNTSSDGNSSYSKIYSYISQLPMETFYNDRVNTLEAFGIETYNETPLFSYGSHDIADGNLSDSDGRTNQLKLIGALNSVPSWNSYISSANNGWTGTENTHKLSASAYANTNAYAACMSRNRDLNGDGQIQRNEVRWFLASLNEYIRMGIGANAISDAAQLYTGVKDQMTHNGYPSNYIKDGALYYTSSASGKRVYWAVEKGSYGAVGSYYDGSKNLPVRCIRNLPAITTKAGKQHDLSSVDDVLSDATYVYYKANGPRPALLVFKDRLVDDLYRGYTGGSLLPHNEGDRSNSFYDGIFVASDYYYTLNDWGNKQYHTFRLGDIIGYNGTVGIYTNNGTMTNPCSNYTEGGYTEWRVPNLVELAAMSAAGIISSRPNGYGSSDVGSCTKFTNQNVRYGFAFSGLIYCPGVDINHIHNRWLLIRCVRDVPPGYTFPTN